MKEYGELSAGRIVSESTAGAAPQERPVAVFVAGQAGSGKTLVMDLVHAALGRRDGAVRVDRDAYKAAHPDYSTFLSEDVRTAGVRVRPETYAWQAEVEAHARACRYDVVLEEALAALGDQWTNTAAPGPSRLLLVACLRQGLRLARDHHLTDLDWLIEAAYVYTDDSVWEPLAPPTTTTGPVPDTPADAVAELLTAIARRQHEHRRRTAERLTAVLDTGLLPTELTEMALYYRAKAYKDLSENTAARTGMQQVADLQGRLAPKARRGLANLARLAGDFPTALAAVPSLGWKGRHHRVLGDIHWSHADTAAAVDAFEAGRAEAEQHGAAGERAMAQVRLALALSFADPARAGDELALAHQLLEGLDQRSNTLLAQVAALIKDAGTDDVTARAQNLNTGIEAAGLPFLHRLVELALAFHHAVRDEDQDLAATIGRLRALTATGDFAYFTDIAHHMAGLPLPGPSATRWTKPEPEVRTAWRGLVRTRQEHLRTGN
ncbi:zeta toxin family protein [Streptomyces sp. ML-6]|uniref:zeta toxin family protein n=1 Tax=Streptomyces sp. ML-6 TaxID=2982693 RepID=UPI0024C0904E|nr:zeta toxin family protein [Streptomyces sp. ML-6]MDK0517528.1 zeta toxin family protein [Streptomyces sp. ML-6]